MTSRHVQTRRVLRSPTVNIDALAAGNIRQRCLGDRSTVSKVSFSAAAVYSPLINSGFQWRDLTLYPASKPDDENHYDSCFTSIRYMQFVNVRARDPRAVCPFISGDILYRLPGHCAYPAYRTKRLKRGGRMGAIIRQIPADVLLKLCGMPVLRHNFAPRRGGNPDH